jgi:hypothetical protein
MKTRLMIFLVLLIFTTNVKAQFPVSEETGEVVFTEVVELEGMNKKEIYDKAKVWVVSTLKSGDNMVELQGENSDKIIGTGNIVLPQSLIDQSVAPYTYFSNYRLNFKFIISFKDNKLKYSVENFNFSLLSTGKIHNMKLVSLDNEINESFTGVPKKKRAAFIEIIKTSSKESIDNMIKDFISNMNKVEEEW